MRHGDTYRAHRRNVTRDRMSRSIGFWRVLFDSKTPDPNTRAKLMERKKQVHDARLAAIGAHLRNKDVKTAVIEFWEGQKRTRVVSRILRELRAQDRRRYV